MFLTFLLSVKAPVHCLFLEGDVWSMSKAIAFAFSRK